MEKSGRETGRGSILNMVPVVARSKTFLHPQPGMQKTPCHPKKHKSGWRHNRLGIHGQQMHSQQTSRDENSDRSGCCTVSLSVMHHVSRSSEVSADTSSSSSGSILRPSPRQTGDIESLLSVLGLTGTLLPDGYAPYASPESSLCDKN